jgi:hypothetical protein
MKFLARFPESKHEQIKQLMGYIQLCGVTGRDLVSIGGYIDRERKKEMSKKNLARIADLDIRAIGAAKKVKPEWPWWHHRWRVVTAAGDKYDFTDDVWHHYKVYSHSTKTYKIASPTNQYSGAWPTTWRYNKITAHEMMMDVADGRFLLNF